MLLRPWLFTILITIAFSIPVPPSQSPPTLTLLHRVSDANLINGLPKSGVNRANQADWHRGGKNAFTGSKTSLHPTGSPSLDGYPALGSGGASYSKTAGDLSSGPHKMGLNKANKSSYNLKGDQLVGNGNNTVVDASSLVVSGGPLDDGSSSNGATTGESTPAGGTSGGNPGITSSLGIGSNTATKGKLAGSEGTSTGSRSSLGGATTSGNGTITSN